MSTDNLILEIFGGPHDGARISIMRHVAVEGQVVRYYKTLYQVKASQAGVFQLHYILDQKGADNDVTGTS